jgi:hypothetical protein
VKATLAALLVALSVPAVAAAYANFRAPGRTVYCEVGDPPPPRVLECWRATDGRSIAMLPTGRALVNPDTNTRGQYEDRAPVLQFGRTWHYRTSYRCTSRRLGVTCTNRSHHGFWLGRYHGYRLF